MPNGVQSPLIFVTFLTLTETPMTLSKEQFAKLVENYASQIIEGLDSASMELMVFDLLVREYETYTEEQIVGEIEELYGEDMVAELMPTVED